MTMNVEYEKSMEKSRIKFCIIFLILVLFHYSDGLAQVENQSGTDKSVNNNYTSGKIEEPISNEVTVSVLPFALYSEIFGWAVGGFLGVQGLSQRNMSLYTGGLISTNGTKYGFIQFREFYLPFYPRLYIAPDILGGYFGVLKVYKDEKLINN